MTETKPQRCALVAIIGAPNAGKSSLVNALVGEDIAPVTHKVQTTRATLRGIAMRGDAQLVLVDTPGVFAPRRSLDRAMVAAAWSALDGADAIVHLIDASAFAFDHAPTPAQSRAIEDTEQIAAKLKRAEKSAILVLNKIDLVARPRLLEITAKLVDEGLYTDVLMISCRTGDRVEDIAALLAERAPEGPWLFPEDQIADATNRVLAAEFTREIAMLRLHDELPYDLTIQTEAWEERRDGSVRIEQTLYVARDSQRKIAIGARGETIKSIGESARKKVQEFLGRRVHLFLHVKVRENWSEDRPFLQSLGLDKDA